MLYKYKKIISALVLLVLIGLFAYYLKDNISDFKKISLVSPYLLVSLFVLFFVGYYLIGLTTLELLKPFKVKLTSYESFALGIITGFYNFITPFHGGMVARAIYLKNKYGFTYTNFFSSLYASYIISFLAASLVGMISTFLIYLESGVFSWIVFLIFLISFIILILVIILSPKIKERNNFLDKFIRVINGWNSIRNNLRLILLITALSLASLLVSALTLYLQFQVFGLEVSLVKCLFLSSLATLTIGLTLTPGGLGVQEAVTVFSALTIGITTAESLAASILGRVISVIVLFILGPIFSYFLIKKKTT